jgi:hypothetical protein
MGSMLLNMAASILGLGNAATPLGLRAMKDLETLNPRPGTATNAMCMLPGHQYQFDPAHPGDGHRHPGGQ